MLLLTEIRKAITLVYFLNPFSGNFESGVLMDCEDNQAYVKNSHVATWVPITSIEVVRY